MAATEPTQSMRFMVCGYVVGALAWLQKIREQRKGLNPIAERLESFRILASEQADSSEEYWGMDFMDEDADPEFDESLDEDELNGGW